MRPGQILNDVAGPTRRADGDEGAPERHRSPERVANIRRRVDEFVQLAPLDTVWKSKFYGASTPRHQRDACSIAWRCRSLTARRSRSGNVITENDLVIIIDGWLSTSSFARGARSRAGRLMAVGSLSRPDNTRVAARARAGMSAFLVFSDPGHRAGDGSTSFTLCASPLCAFLAFFPF